MGGPLSEYERERQQSVTTSIEEAKQRERDGVITHIIKDFHHPKVQPTFSTPRTPALPSSPNNTDSTPRSASPVPINLGIAASSPAVGDSTVSPGSPIGSASGRSNPGLQKYPPPGSAGGAAPPPPGVGRGRRPPSASAAGAIGSSAVAAPKPSVGAPRSIPRPRPRPMAGAKPPPPGGTPPKPAGPPPSSGPAGLRRPKSAAAFGRGRGGGRGGGWGVGRAPLPSGSAPPQPRPVVAHPNTASHPLTAGVVGAKAINADAEVRSVQIHSAAASQTEMVGAHPGPPAADEPEEDLVPIGQPGGLHAREQQREMTARQRLERERRERAKERAEAAEAAAKAAAIEVERAAADAERAAAEEAAAATVAVPSIELGAPGGLHAKIEAEKAMEAFLPSAAESRDRLKRWVSFI
jgi:hypothetical protein